MKRLYLILFVAIQALCASVFAQLPGSTTGITTGTVVVPIKEKRPVPHKPKAPSAQVVEAAYEDGYLYLNFKYSEGPAVLYVYDADQTTLRSQHVFNTDDEAAVYIGTVTDAYLLVETSNGHQYEGWIY